MNPGHWFLSIFLLLLSGQAKADCSAIFREELDEITHPYSMPFYESRGERTAEFGQVDLIHENQTARILGLFGFRVRQNPHDHKDQAIAEEFFWRQSAEGLDPKKRPDYFINRKIFDHLMSHATNAIQVARSILRKTNSMQTHRVVVDLTENPSFRNGHFSLREIFYSLKKKDHVGLWEVIVVHGTADKPEVTTIWPFHRNHPQIAP